MAPKLFSETSSIFELDNIKNASIQRDFLNVWTWQRQKRNKILRDFLNFRSWQHQKRSNSARRPSKMESGMQSWRPCTNAFCDFPFHLSKGLRLPRKSDARSYEVLHLSRKINLANLTISCSKVQPISGNQRMDLLTCLTHVSLVLRLPCEIHLFRSPSNVPGLPTFLKLLQDPHVLLTFGKVQNPLHLPHKNTASTSKNCPNMWCFRHFDFEMCPAPQRHALFQRLNFQKCSDTGMFSTFRLRNVLRATTACTFQHHTFQKCSEHGVLCTCWLPNDLRATRACTCSTSQLPRVFRERCALYILTSKYVLRAITAYNCSSLIPPDGSAPAALASLLFDPPEPQTIGKTQCFRTFPPFRTPASSFFWLSLFSDSSHLCSSSVHIVGSLTSKLPSIINL